MERNGIILKDKELYTIGEVGRICGISAKALRYYDKIGIISPDISVRRMATAITAGRHCCWSL